MRLFFSLISLFFVLSGLAQDSLSVSIDTKYREDQFYASITYNALHNKPDGISSTDLSTGFHLGFIRDMPINEKRNWAIGVGLGVSLNSYNQNLAITQNVNGTQFNNSDAILTDVSKNKFTNYLIDLPIEFRWRTSTPTDYKFWRIYSGIKISYLFYNSSRLESNTLSQNLSNLDEFNKIQYGLTLSAGYGTWNFQLYYGLNPIFNDDAKLNGESIDLKALRVGLIFYIL
ncbi:porin family protein [Winogradskyella litorisediminis]|uniref:Porin family protein n=1 Tax=Winogradskyella litorisediminis TaxID=1156618 RepID=A0ABW3N5W5_9FLAO